MTKRETVMQQMQTIQTQWPQARLKPGMTGLAFTFALILLSTLL